MSQKPREPSVSRRQWLTPDTTDESRKLRTKVYLVRFVMRRSIVHVTMTVLLEG